jgi:hypothetical protein
MDGGGAADLQTDIMRFMAILSLCLVAIFALVQSIPMTPTEAVKDPVSTGQVVAAVSKAAEPEENQNLDSEKTLPAREQRAAAEAPIVLTRPKWVPAPRSGAAAPRQRSDTDSAPRVASKLPEAATPVSQPPVPADGFTLRFESDAALMRAVAAGQVGFYALGNERAQRMAVSNSRISFWDASTPNAFHEMESSTVPAAVVDALAKSGKTNGVNWGVTLPAKMSAQLDSLTQSHSGGSLIIGADGRIRLETP